MSILISEILSRFGQGEYILLLLQLHISLLGATLIFVGFVQSALINSSGVQRGILAKKTSHLISVDIIRRVRVVIVATLAGALIGWIAWVISSALFSLVSSALFVAALVMVGILAYGVTRDFLFANVETVDDVN